jgi:hypothetical protein
MKKDEKNDFYVDRKKKLQITSIILKHQIKEWIFKIYPSTFTNLTLLPSLNGIPQIFKVELI